MEKLRINPELIYGPQRNRGHEFIESKRIEIVQCFCETLLREAIEVKGRILHHRTHIVRFQAIPNPPQAMRTNVHPGKNNHEAFASRNLAKVMLFDGEVNNVHNASPTQCIHNQREMTQALSGFNVHARTIPHRTLNSITLLPVVVSCYSQTLRTETAKAAQITLLKMRFFHVSQHRPQPWHAKSLGEPG